MVAVKIKCTVFEECLVCTYLNRRCLPLFLGFPGGSVVKKNLPAMQEPWVQSLGQEDLLGKEMATHSNILS